MQTILVLSFFLIATPVLAQSRAPSIIQDTLRRNDVNAPRGTSPTQPGFALPAGDPLRSLLSGLTDAVLADFKAARDLAGTADAQGAKAYPNAERCLNEAIPVLELIQKNSATVDGEGVVTAAVKLGILRRKLQSDTLRDACAPWKEEIQAVIGGLAGNVLGVFFGAMKIGL